MQVLKDPDMLCKISQGVTTVIVGNCGISASPVSLQSDPPDPMNLLGVKDDFIFNRLSGYVEAVNRKNPAVNVAALVGHTSLRNNVMDTLDRGATADEIETMKLQLEQALKDGAIGLSTGLAYLSANSAPTEEVLALAEVLSKYGGVYTTHLRTEAEEIIEAMEEAFFIGRSGMVPVVISHLKCAGAGNWGRTKETLPLIDLRSQEQEISFDCYPYSASSSTLDLRQVTDDFDIFITWSDSCPDEAGQLLAAIAEKWEISLIAAAERLMPAGAVYYCMDESDVSAVVSHKDSMIGSDGLPNDPHPHPRLWGAFPRVLGHYCREKGMLSKAEAIRKMTGLPAKKFKISKRGVIAEDNYADLVLFDADQINDMATFESPKQVAVGIEYVWVNGTLTYQRGKENKSRSGRFLER